MLHELPKHSNGEDSDIQTTELDLFVSGNLIHVGRLSKIDGILHEGLHSPAALARKRGARVVNPGFWYPNDNLVVKFLKFQSDNRYQNLQALRQHFEDFGDFDGDWPVGFVVQRSDAVRMAGGEPFFGIEDIVPSVDIKAIVLPVVPMVRQDINHMDLEINRRHMQKIILSLNRAITNGVTLEILVVDHFGRRLN